MELEYLVSCELTNKVTKHYIWQTEKVASFFRGLALEGLDTKGIRVYRLSKIGDPEHVVVSYSKGLDATYFYNRYDVLIDSYRFNREVDFV